MTEPIYACLWFDNQAKEAATFYCGIFKDGKILEENPIVVTFSIKNTKFMALNGGRDYRFTPATSFVVECETQAEIDHFWEKLGKGGSYQMCGWLTDKFGVCWQIVPAILGKLLADKKKAPKVTEAFLKMQKFDIEKLLNA